MKRFFPFLLLIFFSVEMLGQDRFSGEISVGGTLGVDFGKGYSVMAGLSRNLNDKLGVGVNLTYNDGKYLPDGDGVYEVPDKCKEHWTAIKAVADYRFMDGKVSPFVNVGCGALLRSEYAYYGEQRKARDGRTGFLLSGRLGVEISKFRLGIEGNVVPKGGANLFTCDTFYFSAFVGKRFSF